MDRKNIFVIEAPKALPEDVQLAYFKRLRKGDLSVREELINHNIKLVIHIVMNKFYNTSYDMDDLVSEGIIGLMNAVDTFDYDITPKFSTYAVKVIENQILMLLRKPDKKNISLEETLYTKNEENGLTLGDTLRDKNVDLEEKHLSKDLSQIIIKLIDEIEDERERDIVKQTFGFGCERVSQSVLAEKYKVRQPTISRILSKSIRIIAYKLERMDLIEIPSKQRERLNFDELIELIEKNKVKINISQVDNKTNKRFRTIYEYFEEFSHEEVDKAVRYLNPKDLKLLHLKYGDKLDNPYSLIDGSSRESITIYAQIVPRVHKILRILKEQKENNTSETIYVNGRHKTLFEVFSEYSKDEIIKAVGELKPEDERIIYLMYGDNLDSRNPSSELTEKERNRANTSIKKILKQILEYNRSPEAFKVLNGVGYQRKIKTIYEVFSDCTRDEVNYAITLLPEDMKHMLFLRYGYDLDIPYSSEEYNTDISRKINAAVFPRMRRMIMKVRDGKEIILSKDTFRSRDTKTIYEILSSYSREEIDEVISELDDEERKIVNLKNDKNNKLSPSEFDMFYDMVLPKIKNILKDRNKKGGRRVRTIYEIFKEFSHEEVDYVITLLPEDTRHLLYERYGNDLDYPNTDNVISGLNYQRFYSSLLPKMRRLLKTRKSDKEVSIINGRCVKAYKTIYELFEEYSHEEIDAAVSELNEEELRIVHLKYGNDLKNTIKDDSLTKEESKYYYAVIKNKIKTRLVRNRKNKENNLPSKSVMVYNDSENGLNNLMTKDDYIKVVSFLKKMNAREMFRLVNPQDLIITSLRFGYVEDKYYSIKAISKFLGITEREVLESIKRTLDFFNSKSSEMKLTYKEKDNE